MSKKVAIPVEPDKKNPVEIVPDVKTGPIIPMTLEEKVLDYINKHPMGVNIIDMEEQIGEIRMKIGFVTNNLVNEGKVKKIENTFFPAKKE